MTCGGYGPFSWALLRRSRRLKGDSRVSQARHGALPRIQEPQSREPGRIGISQNRRVKDEPSSPAPSQAPKASFASRLFGYDVFISFALGAPPRGSQSYASDLARRLRERDLSVFFSEDELPPGEPLSATLKRALLRSKLLVVMSTAARWSCRTGCVPRSRHFGPSVLAGP